MKTGLTIEELATEIMHQRDVKTDYIVDTTKLCMENYDTSLVLRVLGDNGTDIIEPLDIADTAHRQIGARLGIPAKYYGKMLSEHPELLATNVNAWFNKEPSQRILYNHDTCAYWPEGSEYDDNVTPLCSSVDGKTGYGAPGGACAVCALNQYGSVEKGKGKACKNMRSLYILRSGEFMPLLLSLPPTSLRPYSDFITTAFAARRRPIYSGVVQIGLKRVDNGSNTYSVATFRLLQKFDGEELLQIKQYADGFREQIKTMNQQRALEAELGNSEAISDAVDHGYSSADDGEHFGLLGSLNRCVDTRRNGEASDPGQC